MDESQNAMLSNEPKHQSIHIMWSHSHEIVEKAKLIYSGKKADQWLPGARGG